MSGGIGANFVTTDMKLTMHSAAVYKGESGLYISKSTIMKMMKTNMLPAAQ